MRHEIVRRLGLNLALVTAYSPDGETLEEILTRLERDPDGMTIYTPEYSSRDAWNVWRNVILTDEERQAVLQAAQSMQSIA